MSSGYKGKERRKYARYDYRKSIQCKSIKSSKNKRSFSPSIEGIVKNFSAAGILFEVNAKSVPKISSMLLLELEYKTANICREIERQALIMRNKFLGKVVRIENNLNDTCDVAVALIPKYSRIPKDIKVLVENE